MVFSPQFYINKSRSIYLSSSSSLWSISPKVRMSISPRVQTSTSLYVIFWQLIWILVNFQCSGVFHLGFIQGKVAQKLSGTCYTATVISCICYFQLDSFHGLVASWFTYKKVYWWSLPRTWSPETIIQLNFLMTIFLFWQLIQIFVNSSIMVFSPQFYINKSRSIYLSRSSSLWSISPKVRMSISPRVRTSSSLYVIFLAIDLDLSKFLVQWCFSPRFYIGKSRSKAFRDLLHCNSYQLYMLLPIK